MRVIDVLGAPWAIIPDRLDEITEIYSTHLRGPKIDVKAIESRSGVSLENGEQGYEVIDGVAVVPIEGVIAKKMNMFSYISGGASTQLIERDFRQAMRDPEVHSIILHADTPGGSVDGTAELAKVIFDARGDKPIYTLADGLMASAGVWIGSAADKVFMTSETALIGSIGVVTQHVDYSERNKKLGVEVTEIYAGKYKRIDSVHKPLSDEGREYLQSEVDYLYSIFVDTVAQHRGTSSTDVLDRMADGRLFVGRQSIEAGLVDGVATLDQLINALNDESALETLLASSGGERPSSQNGGSEDGGTVADADGVEIDAESSGDDEEANPSEQNTMDMKTLKEEHPDLYAAVRQKGFDAGAEQGAKQECDRIRSVRDQSMPGHESVIEGLMFDGKTTGEQAAVAVLQAEKEKRQAASAARSHDAGELDDVAATVETDDSNNQAGDNQTPAEKRKARWDSDAGLRSEFDDDFERFEAFDKNTNRTKVLGGKD